MTRLLHLSDIHFGCENPAALAAATAFAAEHAPDLIVITGDITQYGAKSEFAAAAWLKTLPGAWISTPGNHDTPYLGLGERLAAPFARYRRSVGEPWEASHIAPGFKVQTMNSARGLQARWNWSKGAVGAGQARGAARALKDADVQAEAEVPGVRPLRVLACHHPLMEITGGPMTGRVRGGNRAARILAEAQCDLILTGHAHSAFARPLPFGDRRTYAVGAGTLSLRERGEPAGFNLIEADAEAVRVTAHAWTGAALEVRRTWSLPRRA